MAIRKIMQRGDKVLTSVNQQIPLTDVGSSKVKQVLTDLFDTMHDRGLIAMAAPQIGENYKIFITELRETKVRNASEADQPRIFINPQIIASSTETDTICEGCGSVSGAESFGAVLRPKVITVAAYDEQGRKFTLRCDGLLARAIQHEYDHLQGQEFLDRMAPEEKPIPESFYQEHIRFSPEHQLASKVTIKEFHFSTSP